jgi:hypothetical protein
MKNSLIISLLFLSTLTFAQTKGGYVKGGDYEGANFSGKHMISKNKNILSYFTPTSEEIDSLEAKIEVRLTELKTTKTDLEFPTFIIDNLKDYKRQYFGYVNEKGERIIYFNFFHNSGNVYGWREGEVVIKDGGYYYWRMKWNLTTNDIIDFYVNGEA